MKKKKDNFFRVGIGLILLFGFIVNALFFYWGFYLSYKSNNNLAGYSKQITEFCEGGYSGFYSCGDIMYKTCEKMNFVCYKDADDYYALHILDDDLKGVLENGGEIVEYSKKR